MPTFARGYWIRRTTTSHQPGPRQPIQTTMGRVTWTLTASDAITLRGIPVQAPGVAGHIAHTRPDTGTHPHG